MNKAEFMRQLENLLQDISPVEREAALQYYEDYFNDAGEENEQSVIRELGSPEKVAGNIKKEDDISYFEGNTGQNRYYEKAVSDIPWREEVKKKESEKHRKMSIGMIILLIVLGICAFPVLGGLLISVFGVLFGVIATIFGLVIGLGITTVVLVALMVFFLVIGVLCMFQSGLTSIALIGGGLVCGGIGLLFLIFTVISVSLLPILGKGIVKLWKMIFAKKRL